MNEQQLEQALQQLAGQLIQSGIDVPAFAQALVQTAAQMQQQGGAPQQMQQGQPSPQQSAFA